MAPLATLARRLFLAPTSPAQDLIRTSNGQEARATSGLQNPASWLFDVLTGGTSNSGITVNAHTAAAHGDVYSCIRVLTDAVSSLPCHVYRRTDTGRERASDSLPARLLDRPSNMLTPSALWATVMAHLLLYGNCFIGKLRSGPTGIVTRLWPIAPSRVTVEIIGGEPFYRLAPDATDTQGGTFTRRDILHVKGLSLDGYVGLSPITQARESLGIGMALEEYAATFFKNSAFPGGVITTPQTLSEDAAGRLKRSWNAFHQGLKKSSSVAVLEAGAQFNALSIPPEDAQFIEQRRLSATQIARIFRVPPWMIGADSGSTMTYSNVEQQMLQFAVYSVRPWLVTIEQAFAADEDIFGDQTLYPEFLMDALLRADTTTRAKAYDLALNNWMTQDEIRALENLPPLPGGDVIQKAAPVAATPSAAGAEPDTDDLPET